MVFELALPRESEFGQFIVDGSGERFVSCYGKKIPRLFPGLREEITPVWNALPSLSDDLQNVTPAAVRLGSRYYAGGLSQVWGT